MRGHLLQLSHEEEATTLGGTILLPKPFCYEPPSKATASPTSPSTPASPLRWPDFWLATTGVAR